MHGSSGNKICDDLVFFLLRKQTTQFSRLWYNFYFRSQNAVDSGPAFRPEVIRQAAMDYSVQQLLAKAQIPQGAQPPDG